MLQSSVAFFFSPFISTFSSLNSIFPRRSDLTFQFSLLAFVLLMLQLVVVDGRAHLLGRLASVVAKELLSGQKVVIVRSEEVNISGSFFRNKRTRSFHLLACSIPI
jgi:hypothetical protein